MIPKKLILLAVFFVGGIVLIFLGTSKLLDARRLAAQGKLVAAEVVDRRVQRLYKDHNTHHLIVAFQAGSNRRVTNEVMVTQAVYDQTPAGKGLQIIYLPKVPSVCIIGNHVEMKVGQLVIGFIFVGLGVATAILFGKFPSIGKIGPMTESEITEKVRPVATEGAKKLEKRSVLNIDTNGVVDRIEPWRGS